MHFKERLLLLDNKSITLEAMKLNQKTKTVITILVVSSLALGLIWVFDQQMDSRSAHVSQKAIEDQTDKAIPYENVLGMIAPHKALYSMSLSEIHAGSPITELLGEMFFKWEDTCDAWSTDHRFTIDYFYTDRPSISVTSHFVAWEDKTGNRIQFVSEGYTDGVLDEKTRGEARRLDDGTGDVNYQEPQGMTFELGKNFFFPAQHTVATIHNALEGKNFFNAVMFDGTDQEGPSEVNVFIEQPAMQNFPVARYTDNPAVDTDLLKTPSWNTRLAFYPQQGEGSDLSTPAYEMMVRLHQNGVVSDIVIEYDSFSVRQSLVALSALPQAECQNNKNGAF